MFGIVQGYIDGIMYFLLPVLRIGLQADNKNDQQKVDFFHGVMVNGQLANLLIR